MAEAAKPAAAAAPADVSKNCFGCGKPMKRAKRYYRNGHYFCNKNCFVNKKKVAAAAEPAAA